MVVMLRLALISDGGIIRLVDRPVLLLVICFVAVGLCVGDDEEDLVDRANDRESVMLKGGRMREREGLDRPFRDTAASSNTIWIWKKYIFFLIRREREAAIDNRQWDLLMNWSPISDWLVCSCAPGTTRGFIQRHANWRSSA